MKFKILIVVGKFYYDAATHFLKGSTSLLDQYKKFETVQDWVAPSILPHFPNESEDTSLRKHAIEYKILNAPGVFEIPRSQSRDLVAAPPLFFLLGSHLSLACSSFRHVTMPFIIGF